MTEAIFWTLPGPNRFVSNVRNDLERGISVVVRLPLIGVPGVERRLAESLRGADVRCDSLGASVGTAPLAQVLAGLGGGYGAEPPQRALRRACEQNRRVLVVDGIAPQQWKEWRSFLIFFNDCARQLPQMVRPSLVALLRGNGFGNVQCEDVALRCRDWPGTVSRSDAICLAEHLLPLHEGRQEVRQVLVHTLASIAMWDCELLERLAEQPPKSILDPFENLCDYAAARQWSGKTPIDEWIGTAASYEGRTATHLALLVGRGDRAALNLALWKAQVGVILPGLELQKLDIVDELVKSRHASPEDRSREIGDLCSRFCCNQRVGNGIRRRLQEMRRIRNELAHKRHLSAEEVIRTRFL